MSDNDIDAFKFEVERPSRTHPLVLISCDNNDILPVDTERMRSMLVGLAQVVQISPNVDTFRMQNIMGRKYTAFAGAINIISPFRRMESGGLCKSTLILPDRQNELLDTGITVESEILALVTHQTNIPHSWKHVSIERVREAILRQRLHAAVAQSHQPHDLNQSNELKFYEELLCEVSDQLSIKDQELADTRFSLEEKAIQIDQLAAENEGVKHALSLVRSSSTSNNQVRIEPEPDLAALRAAFEGAPTLEQCLMTVGSLYPERVVILDSALSSATESDRAGFQRGAKALELLRTLAGDYWRTLVEGGGDQQGRQHFGKFGFAAKESDTLSVEGKNRRTFRYKGKDLLDGKAFKARSQR